MIKRMKYYFVVFASVVYADNFVEMQLVEQM